MLVGVAWFWVGGMPAVPSVASVGAVLHAVVLSSLVAAGPGFRWGSVARRGVGRWPGYGWSRASRVGSSAIVVGRLW